MGDRRTADPADLMVEWEAVEELLTVVPEGIAKNVLRMIAAGMPVADIAERLALRVDEVEVHAARARIRLLTAALPDRSPASMDD
ncbi:hypothetical protein BH23ACT10_BH23ACT10_27130 [soil metagenome]